MQKTDRDTSFTDICPSCNKIRINSFCHHCGEERIYEDSWFLDDFLQDFRRFFSSLDSRLYQSTWLLIIRPGQLTIDYWAGRRKPHLSPVQLFFFFNLLLFLLASQPGVLYYPWENARQAFPDGLGLPFRALELAPGQALSPGQFAAYFDRTAHGFSMLFLCLLVPAFARLLYILYGEDELFYLKHLVFAGHFMAIVLALLLLSSALAGFFPPAYRPLFKLVLVTGAGIPYLYRSIRTVYGKQRREALWQTVALFAGLILGIVALYKPAVTLLASLFSQ